MRQKTPKYNHAPVHPVGLMGVPVELFLSVWGSHLKGILSPFSVSKNPSLHRKPHCVSSLAVVGLLTASSLIFAVDSGLSLLQVPASILSPLIFAVSTVHVCTAEHGQKIVK